MIATDLEGLVRMSGRAWWEARYSSGRVITEWAVTPGGAILPHLAEAGHWDELEGEGLIGVRLLCPDGSIAELATRHDHRLFQFKVGGVTATAGQQVHWCAAHVIGAVTDKTGRCVCRAWETAERRLVAFEDNVLGMRYRSVGALALERVGIRI